MAEIQDIELLGDWTLTGGAINLFLHLQQDGTYLLEKVSKNSQNYGTLLASHSGTWLTLPHAEVQELSTRWLTLTVTATQGVAEGHQFAWPNDTCGAGQVMLLLEKYAPAVFNALDSFDGEMFNALMVASRNSGATHKPLQTITSPTALLTADPGGQPGNLNPPPATTEETAPTTSQPTIQGTETAALQAELDGLTAALAGKDQPALLAQVESLRQQVKAEQVAMDAERQAGNIDA